MAAPPASLKQKRPPPKLPASAFNIPTLLPRKRLSPAGLIDTHIHLWTREQLDSNHVIWPLHESTNSVLAREHTLEQYGDVVGGGVGLVGEGGKVKFEGAVFVQAEAKHDDTDVDGTSGGWDSALDEVEVVCQAALSHPSVKLLALVPWAPVHLGALALSAYFTRLEALPSLMKLGVPISSVRYLLQDCPRGFFLSDKFVEGLQWLGEKGVGFDMTLDVVQLGAEVLEDAVDCIQQVREGQAVGKQTRFILDHFAKPPLIPSPTFPPSPAQEAYIAALFSLSLLSDVSLKLSGMLDSAEPTLVREAFDEWRAARERKGQGEAGKKVDELRRRVLTFLEPAVEAFGEERIVVGSDWPMFRAKTISPSSSSSSATLNKEEESAAWAFEMELYRTALVELGVEGEGLDRVFEGNARGFYGC